MCWVTRQREKSKPRKPKNKLLPLVALTPTSQWGSVSGAPPTWAMPRGFRQAPHLHQKCISQHKNFCPQRTKCIWFKLANSDPLLCLICWLQHCPHFPLSCKYNKNFFTRRSKYSLEVQGFKYKDILAATPTKTHAGVYLSQMLVKVKALAGTISNVLMFTFTFLMFPWTDMLPSSFYLQFSTCHPLKFNTLKDFLLLNTTLITSIHSELGPYSLRRLYCMIR